MSNLLFPAILIGVAVFFFLRARNRIDPAEAKRMVGEGAVLLDVRTQSEFRDAHVHGAKNIPVSELGGQLSSLAKDKKYVVYCHSGMRSASAVSQLKKAGFDAVDLGPMARWPE